jgi:hypothetical protein
MTILELIILIVALFLVALFISYQMQRGTKTMQEFKDDYYNNEEVQEVAELVQELYNKDLRPIAAKKIKETKPEFPIEAPKKKRKYYPKKPKTSI